MSNLSESSPWDESRLVSLLKQGREDAYRVLIQKYQKLVFRIAYGITFDQEESLDITQEVFLKVYQNIHRFEQKSKLSTWLHRITVNEGLNWKRRWKRRLRWRHHSFEEAFQQDSHEPESDEEGPEDRYLKKEFSRKIQDVLLKLPEDARTVFVLKEMEGLSYEEIAETLNIKRGTVSSRLFYARKRLKDLLEDVADET